MSKYQELFTPIKIGGVEIKNRFFLAPMGNFGTVDTLGALTNEGIEFYVERARGGIGLIITGFCIADASIEEVESPSILAIRENQTDFLQQSALLTERIHAYGSKIFLQLSSGFGRIARVVKVNRRIGVSDAENMYVPEQFHRALTTEEVKGMVKSFGKAAVLAKKCGFDGVEIHAVHEGYFLDQFTMEFFNKRTDEYGGSFENRYRLPCEVVQEIKLLCGGDFPVTLRYSIKHFMKGLRRGILPEEMDTVQEMGRDVEEGLIAAKYLEKAGYDGFDADVGCYEAHYWSHPNVFIKDAPFLELAAKLSQAVSVPVMVAGRMDHQDIALQAVQSNQCQMIGLGRPALADPQLVNKIQRGLTEEIRRCISCHHGCQNGVFNKSAVRCTVNPQCARETMFALRPTLQKKRVAVIGGGPAGMQAALTCAMRGHDVTLYEKQNRLGGNMLYAGMILYKHHVFELLDWYKHELDRFGVHVVHNAEATPEFVEHLDVDALFVATGSNARALEIPGLDSTVSYYPHEIFHRPEVLGDEVTMIGAGQIGMETAIWLGKLGKKIHIVELADLILGGINTVPPGDWEMINEYMLYFNMDMHMRSCVTSVEGSNITVRNVDTDEESHLQSDSILIAVGYTPNNRLFNQLQIYPCDDVFHIGDSNSVSNMYYAIHNAYELANNL